MPEKNRIGVIGVALDSDVRDETRSLEELQYDITMRVLRDAGITIEAIDGIVVAGNDQYDGRAISIMAASGSVGGVDRDILSTPSAAEHAFVLGALRVLSGLFQTQLVVAWSPTEASSIPEVQRLAADPYFHRALPLDEPASHALQASVLASRIPGIDELAKSVAAKNRRHGKTAGREQKTGSGRAPWPLEGLLSPPTTGLVALVLASSAFIAEHGIENVAWLEGMGWATEPSFLGDRDLSSLPSLDEAVRQAYAQANIKNPLTTFNLAEVSDTTPYQELLAYECLGLCPRSNWAKSIGDGTFATGGKLPVNLSGGAQSSNPVFCSGLVRIAELANQIRGRAGLHQLKGARRGVAQASSGPAMQYNTVVVLGDGQMEAR